MHDSAVELDSSSFGISGLKLMGAVHKDGKLKVKLFYLFVFCFIADNLLLKLCLGITDLRRSLSYDSSHDVTYEEPMIVSLRVP